MQQNSSIGDRYDLGAMLGSGGMGRVYRARDRHLGREVAIKVLGEHHAGTPEFVERFEREVKNVASLNHPNIVRVFDSGKDDDGSPYMVMELVGGGTLKDRIHASGPLPPREAAGVMLQVVEALGSAHDAGIVHRDVKPENVLLTEDGDAKVADFGIARATEATAMTHTSMVLGTAPYLSPEQARGEPVGPASDLYSLGVVLYETLTGRTPFGTGEHVSPLAIAMKHCTEPAPSPRTADRRVPEPLEIITLTLMRKHPAERYAGAAALAGDLAAFLEGRELSSAAANLVASSPEGTGTQVLRREPEPRRRRRRKILPVMAAALACVLVLAFSPLVPMQKPVSLVESTVAPDAEALGRAASPAMRSHPGAPEAPEGDRPEAPQPEPDSTEPDSKKPEVRQASRPAPVAEEPDVPAAVSSASASAGSSADASASASASASSTADASAPAVEETPAQTPEPAAKSATPSPAPDASEPEEPDPVEPPSVTPPEEPAEVESPSVPPTEVEAPEVEKPEIDKLEVEVPEVEMPDF